MEGLFRWPRLDVVCLGSCPSIMVWGLINLQNAASWSGDWSVCKCYSNMKRQTYSCFAVGNLRALCMNEGLRKIYGHDNAQGLLCSFSSMHQQSTAYCISATDRIKLVVSKPGPAY